MAVLISVTEDDVTQIVLADVGVQGATGPSSPASGTPFTPYGNIAATNVQTAIQELDDEKFGKAGGTVTGNLEIGTGGTLSFEGATADGFETTLAVVDPTADRTLTLPNVTGTFVTTGDTGTVTSTMLLDGTILNADVSASAAIVDTKLATIATAGKVSNSATTAASANTASAIVVRDASGNFTAGTITAALTGAASSNVLKAGDTMTGPLVIPAGTVTAAGIQVGTGATYKPGIYSPGAEQLAISTNGTGGLFIDGFGRVGIGAISSGARLDVRGGAGPYMYVVDSGANGGAFVAEATNSIVNIGSTYLGTAAVPLAFVVGGNEKARLDTSGRLLVGTSTALTGSAGPYASQYSRLVVVGNSSGSAVGIGALGYNGAGTGLGVDTSISVLNFTDNAGAQFASIACQTDATTAAGDYPGRLVFSTTADGAASPTEAMRIKSTGIINFSNVPTYADNTAATAGGLAVGDVYKTVLGDLMIRF